MTVIQVAIRDIVQPPWQPEGRTDTESEELAASIRIHGIIEPPIVRRQSGMPHLYELVCGCRRIAAARIVYGADAEIECIIKELTDEEARGLAHAENTKRLALTPLQEAFDFAALRNERRFNLDKIAAARCVSKAHVEKRLALLLLNEEPREALVAGRISESFAVMLAGLPADGQRAALKDFDQSPLVAQVMRRSQIAIIDRQRRKFSDAPFELTDKSLGAEACHGCTRRTGVQGSLFDEENIDRCLDPKCFDGKAKLIELRKKQDVGDASTEEKEQRPKEKPGKEKPILPAPVKSLEPQATAIATEEALVELAKKAAAPKRDLSEQKLWQLLAGMITRLGASAIDDALERRGGPDGLDARLVIISKMSAHDCAGFLVEALARLGNGGDESAFLAGLRHFKIDLAKIRSEALVRLQEDARPAPKARPMDRPLLLGHLRTHGPSTALQIHQGSLDNFTFGDVEKACVALIKDGILSVSTPAGSKERIYNLVSAEEAKPAVEPSPKAIEYSVICKRCKKGVDVVCKKEGGGFHVERTKDAVAARDARFAHALSFAPPELFEARFGPSGVTTPPSSSPATFALDQRVVVTSGPHKGRVGVVEHATAKGINVLLDRLDGERGRPRRPLFNPKELAPDPPPSKK